MVNNRCTTAARPGNSAGPFCCLFFIAAPILRRPADTAKLCGDPCEGRFRKDTGVPGSPTGMDATGPDDVLDLVKGHTQPSGDFTHGGNDRNRLNCHDVASCEHHHSARYYAHRTEQ